MTEIRKVREFDGLCTVFVGTGLILSDLSESLADAVAAKLGSPEALPGPSPERGRRVGRISERGPASRAVRPLRTGG